MADGQSDFEKSGQKISSTNVYSGGNATPTTPRASSGGGSTISNPNQPQQPSSIYQAGGEVLGSADKSGNRAIYSRIEGGQMSYIGTLTRSGQVLMSETGQQRYAEYQRSGSTSQTPRFTKEGTMIAEKPPEQRPPSTPESNIIGAPTQPTAPQPDYAKLDYSATTPERKSLLESTYEATASYLFGRKYSELPSEQQGIVQKTALESEGSYYRGAIKEEARIKSGYTREPSPYMEAITGGMFGAYLQARGVEPPKVDTSVPSVSGGAPSLAPSPTTSGGEQYTYTYGGREITEQQAKDIETSNKVIQEVIGSQNLIKNVMYNEYKKKLKEEELQTGTSENVAVFDPLGLTRTNKLTAPFTKTREVDIGAISETVHKIKKYSPELRDVQATVFVNPFGKEDTIIMPMRTEDLAGKNITVKEIAPTESQKWSVGQPQYPEGTYLEISYPTYDTSGKQTGVQVISPEFVEKEKKVESGTISYSAILPVKEIAKIEEVSTTTPEGTTTTTLKGTENIKITATPEDVVLYNEYDFYKHPQTETGKMFKSFLDPSIKMSESMEFDIGNPLTYQSAIPKFIAEYGEKPIIVGAESMHLGLLPEPDKETGKIDRSLSGLWKQTGYSFGGVVYSFAGGTSIGIPFSLASSGRYLSATAGKSFVADSVYMQSLSGRLGLVSDVALKTPVGIAGISYGAGYTIGGLMGQDPVKSGLSAVVGSSGAIGGAFAPISLGKIAMSDIITGGTGMALYTAEYDKTATPEQLATSFAIGGAIGGAIGVAGAYASEGKIPSINVGTSRYYVETPKGMQERIGYTGVWLTKGSETGILESKVIPFISRKTGWDLSGRAIQMGGISDFTIPSGATKVLPTDILAEQSLRPMAKNLYETQAITKYLGGVGYAPIGAEKITPVPKGEIPVSSEWKKYVGMRKLVEPIYKGDIPAQITFEDVLENAPRFKGGLGKSSLEFFKQFKEESMMYGSATMKMKYGEAGLPREIHDIDIQLYGKGYTPEQIAQKYVAFQQAKGYNVKIAKGETSQVVRQMETGEWEKVLDIHVSGYEGEVSVPFGRTPESLGFHSQLPVKEGDFFYMKAGESATRKVAGGTTWMKTEEGDWIVGATPRRVKDIGDALENLKYIGETGKMLPKNIDRAQYLAEVKLRAKEYGYTFQDKLTVPITEPKIVPKVAELSIKPSTYISPAVSKGLTVSSGKLTGISMPKASYPSPSASKSMPLSASPYTYPSVSKSISPSAYKSISASVSKSLSKSTYTSEYPSVSAYPSSYPSRSVSTSVSVSKSPYPSEYPSYYPSSYSPKIIEPVPPVAVVGGIPWLDTGAGGKARARKFSGKTRGLIYATVGKFPKIGKKGGF